jgi:hypothetical protein
VPDGSAPGPDGETSSSTWPVRRCSMVPARSSAGLPLKNETRQVVGYVTNRSTALARSFIRAVIAVRVSATICSAASCGRSALSISVMACCHPERTLSRPSPGI